MMTSANCRPISLEREGKANGGYKRKKKKKNKKDNFGKSLDLGAISAQNRPPTQECMKKI